MRRALVALLLPVTLTLSAAPPALCRIDTMAAADKGICGVWQLGGDGAIVRISHGVKTQTYTLSVVRCADPALVAGTVIGEIKPTGRQFTYDASLCAYPDGPHRHHTPRRHNFIFEFDPRYIRFSIRHYRKGINLNMLRALPYLFRVSVQRDDTRPAGIDGAVKLAPLKHPLFLDI